MKSSKHFMTSTSNRTMAVQFAYDLKNLSARFIAAGAMVLFTAIISATAQTPDLTPKSVLDVMQQVADWQLANPSRHKPTDWTQGAGDAGFMALAGISGDVKYRDAMLAMGETNIGSLARENITPMINASADLCGTLFPLSRTEDDRADAPAV